MCIGHVCSRVCGEVNFLLHSEVVKRDTRKIKKLRLSYGSISTLNHLSTQINLLHIPTFINTHLLSNYLFLQINKFKLSNKMK